MWTEDRDLLLSSPLRKGKATAFSVGAAWAAWGSDLVLTTTGPQGAGAAREDAEQPPAGSWLQEPTPEGRPCPSEPDLQLVQGAPKALSRTPQRLPTPYAVPAALRVQLAPLCHTGQCRGLSAWLPSEAQAWVPPA